MSLSSTSNATHIAAGATPATNITCTWVSVQPTYNGIYSEEYSLTACAGYSIVVGEDVLYPPDPVTRYVYLLG